MISINGTLLVQLAQFLILTFILNRLMIQPILKLVQERKQHMENLNRDIQEIEAETRRLAEDFLVREKAARKEAYHERIRLKQEGLTEAESYIEEAERQTLSLREEQEKLVAAEIGKVRPNLREEAEALVNELSEKVIGRRIPA